MKPRMLILFSLLILSGVSVCQKEGLYWYFGVHAGLNFNNGEPVPLTDGALSTTEGCSTISSPGGTLMLYTDGITVYNGKHHIISGGDGLTGSPDATQSAVIVPAPFDTTLYYIFTVSSLGVGQPDNGFRYTLVNMKANGGEGQVVSGGKNIMIYPSTTERVTSVHHRNSVNIWVIMHEWESSRFRAYLVTPAGINITNPVVSNIGLYHGRIGDHNRNGIGYMKASPDGKRLAVAIMGLNVVEVFDFNDSTGVLTNPMTLPVDTVPYGVEFSTESEFLYASERIADKIYQWDMHAGSPEDIQNSREVVGVLDNPFGGALQMAPDGKIYIARKSRFYLSRIKYPYLKGTDCGFEEVGIDLDGRQSKEGLPTFIQSYFNYFWITSKKNCINQEIEFTLSSPIQLDSVLWDFGDPASGANNLCMGDSVKHNFSEPGYYLVTANCYQSNYLTIKEKEVQILPLPKADLGNDTTVCRGDTVTFTTSVNYLSWMWLDNPALNQPYYKSADEGQVKVTVSNVCGKDSDSVYLFVKDYPEVDLGKDTMIKYNTYITLDAGNQDQNFLWQNGSTSNGLNINYPGTYWVDVWDDVGCKSSDTIHIEPVPFTIQVPNAFSPNGDDINPYFRVYTNYDVDIRFEMMIFNRYGELVFESHSVDEKWDGTYHYAECPMEVYTWILKAETLENNAFFPGKTVQKGTVTLIR